MKCINQEMYKCINIGNIFQIITSKLIAVDLSKQIELEDVTCIAIE